MIETTFGSRVLADTAHGGMIADLRGRFNDNGTAACSVELWQEGEDFLIFDDEWNEESDGDIGDYLTADLVDDTQDDIALYDEALAMVYAALDAAYVVREGRDVAEVGYKDILSNVSINTTVKVISRLG